MRKFAWTKSSASPNDSNCVEVFMTDDAVMVRDTKDHGQGPMHTYTHAEWKAFLQGVCNGEFDLT